MWKSDTQKSAHIISEQESEFSEQTHLCVQHPEGETKHTQAPRSPLAARLVTTFPKTVRDSDEGNAQPGLNERLELVEDRCMPCALQVQTLKSFLETP